MASEAIDLGKLSQPVYEKLLNSFARLIGTQRRLITVDKALKYENGEKEFIVKRGVYKYSLLYRSNGLIKRVSRVI